MNLTKEELLDVVKEAIQDAFREDMASDEFLIDEQLPKTIAFRGPNIESVSENINNWVDETQSFIINLSVNRVIDQGQDECEVLVVYEPEPMDDTPDWLKGLSE